MKKFKALFSLLIVLISLVSACDFHSGNEELPENQQEEQNNDSQIEAPGNEEEQESQDTENEDNAEEAVIMYAQTGVNVRKGPGTTYDIVGKLNTNDKIAAFGEPVDGWQKVLYNEEEAYVSAQYLGIEPVEVIVSDTPPAESSGNQVPEITEIPDLEVFVPENGNGILVVIDAGHQGVGNSQKEPDGPGSSNMKAKVSSGTSGCVSGWKEYQLNLVVSMKLKEELLARGYSVAMIRETNEINISNMTRAEAANKLNADAFVRIHANSSEDSSVYGAMTLCQTPSNPYNADLYEQCRALSDCVLDEFVKATDAKKRSVWETDTMSGINWCRVPVTIVEMGFMSNPQEDTLMATDDYQNKMVKGIANGIDKYFENLSN